MYSEQQVLDFLESLHIPYTLQTHPPVHTMEDCFVLQNIPENTQMPKNIFLCNRQETTFYLFITEPQTPFKTAIVSKLLNVSRLSFAKEEHLERLLHVTSGAVNPLSLLFDETSSIQFVMDSALLSYEYLAFHPLVNTATVIMKTSDFIDVFLKEISHELIEIQL